MWRGNLAEDGPLSQSYLQAGPQTWTAPLDAPWLWQTGTRLWREARLHKHKYIHISRHVDFGTQSLRLFSWWAGFSLLDVHGGTWSLTHSCGCFFFFFKHICVQYLLGWLLDPSLAINPIFPSNLSNLLIFFTRDKNNFAYICSF